MTTRGASRTVGLDHMPDPHAPEVRFSDDRRTRRKSRAYARGIAYESPTITEYGSLEELTQAHMAMELVHYAQFGVGFAASVVGPPSPRVVPDQSTFTPVVHASSASGAGGGGGGGGAGATTALPDPTIVSSSGDPTSVSDALSHSGASQGGTTLASVSSGGGAGKNLPFTGYAAALVAGVGLSMAAAGRAIRRFSRD
jgi:hypothetical protein